MLNRLFVFVVIIAAAYWYWAGPYQQRTAPDYAEQLRQNAEKMRQCIRGANFKAEATGISDGIPEKQCAQRYNLYFEDGNWHSYDAARRDS
jgi:hypothetical protein